MSKFKYKVVDEKGRLIQGATEAISAEEVAKNLAAQGFTPVDIAESLPLPDFSQVFNFSAFWGRIQRPKPREIMLFFRQLAALFSAGVPLFESLVALEEQFNKEKSGKIITKLKEDVAGGISFSGALSRHPEVFPNLVVAMVNAGEHAGALDEVLRKIASFLEQENQLRTKIQSALRYPALVMTALGVAFIFAVIFIIPKFSTVFRAFGAQLPLPTRILLAINFLVINYWWAILIGGVIASILFNFYRATPFGRWQWDSTLMKLPVLGLLITKVSLARFFGMLSSMISSGVSIINGLEITANTADNAVISLAITKIREKVVSGVALSEGLKEYRFFPPTSVQMVAVGEKSGTLDNMLLKCSEYFNEETDYTVSNLMSLLEPILVFVLGLLVLLLALGIFLPMWSMLQLYTQ